MFTNLNTQIAKRLGTDNLFVFWTVIILSVVILALVVTFPIVTGGSILTALVLAGGSILSGVVGFFFFTRPSGRTVQPRPNPVMVAWLSGDEDAYRAAVRDHNDRWL